MTKKTIPSTPALEKQAWDLVRNGHTYEGAAKTMGLSGKQRVHSLIKSYLARPSTKAQGIRSGNLPLRQAGIGYGL